MPVSEPGNMRPLINKIVNTKYGSVAVPQTTIPENGRAQCLFKCQTTQYRTSIDTPIHVVDYELKWLDVIRVTYYFTASGITYRTT